MKIRIAPATLLFLFLLAFDQSLLLSATLLAALFHECGHLVAARLLDIPIRLMEIDLFGAKIYPARFIPSYRQELLLAVAGPLFSLLLGVFLLPHGGALSVAMRDATFSFALFNLLPISDFDGGRILHATLSQFLEGETADRVLSITSYLSLFLLFSLSSCILLKYGQNLALAVLSASLFAQLFLPQNKGKVPPV